MCYGDPDELLKKLLEANPPAPNRLGNTPLDDFDHVCAVSGLDENKVGYQAFAWAKYFFISARLMP